MQKPRADAPADEFRREPKVTELPDTPFPEPPPPEPALQAASPTNRPQASFGPIDYRMSTNDGIPKSLRSHIARRRQDLQRAAKRLSQLPGVEVVGAANLLPFDGNDTDFGFDIENYVPRSGNDMPDNEAREVLPGYFAGASLVFVGAFTDLGTPLVFNYLKVIPVRIFFEVSDPQRTNAVAYALVVITLVITAVLFFTTRWLVARRSYAGGGKGADPNKFKDKHDKDQWKRLRSLPNIIYSDGN